MSEVRLLPTDLLVGDAIYRMARESGLGTELG